MACGAVAAVTQPAHADPVDAWSYEATPYLHAAGLNGTIGAGRVTTHTDISFSDVLSHLDLALQGQFLARKGPLSLGLDAEYIRLSDDGSRSVTGPEGRATVLGKLDATSTLAILQGTVGYRILDEQTKVDIIGALRATRLDADLDLDGTLSVGDAVFGRSRSVSGSRDWIDAVVGARILHAISDQVTLSGYADVGGGGSNLTWQVLAGVNWRVAKDYTVKLGYRELSWDYSGGGVVWDMKMRGPYFGLGIRF
jgi:opacity protein-like surface antigen